MALIPLSTHMLISLSSVLYMGAFLQDGLTQAFTSRFQTYNFDKLRYESKPNKAIFGEMPSIQMDALTSMDSNNSEKQLTTKKQKNNRKKSKRKNTVKGKTSKSESPKATQKKLMPITELKLGSKIDGVVAAFTSFGIFIKINYDLKGKGSVGYALLHKSQIRDEPVDDLSKLFRIGATVKGLRVVQINYGKGEVGLSLRSKRPNRKDMKEVPLGQEIQGTVANVVSYGAFIDVGANVNALLHISRISQKKIRNIREVINEGDKVLVHIIEKDEEKKSMAASMLDIEADEYLDRRATQMKKLQEKARFDDDELKSEIEYFEEAIRELEESL